MDPERALVEALDEASVTDGLRLRIAAAAKAMFDLREREKHTAITLAAQEKVNECVARQVVLYKRKTEILDQMYREMRQSGQDMTVVIRGLADRVDTLRQERDREGAKADLLEKQAARRKRRRAE